MEQRIDVLDKGYVRLISVMGDDLEVVNDARVSHDKESEWRVDPLTVSCDPLTPGMGIKFAMKEKDRKLLFHLAAANHWSPFSHSCVKLEVSCPWIVKEQWRKSTIGGVYTELPPDADEAWNEKSFRYSTRTPETYAVRDWLKAAPKHSHQGDDGDLDERVATYLETYLRGSNEEAINNYRVALAADACPQQARFFLPVSVYTKFRWRASLYRIISWLKLREAEDAQWEIVQFANAVHQLVEPHFPVSFEAWGLSEGKELLAETIPSE